MSSKPRTIVSVVLGVVVLAGALASPVSPAFAASLPHVDVSSMSSMFQMVVTDDRIFLSPGAGGSAIRMLRHDLSDAGSLTGVPGASGMTIAGDVLYVASESASRIDRFDLSTDPPTQLEAWDTSAVGAPRWLAVAGGYLWFTDCVADVAVLGRVNLATGNTADRTPDDGPGSWNDCAQIEWSPFAPDLLTFIGVSNSWNAFVFDVSSGLPVFQFEEPIGLPVAIEILPDGTQWATSFNGGLATFPLGDLETPDDVYEPVEQTNWAWNGLAVTDAGPGMMALIGRNNGLSHEIRVWKVGRTKEWRSFDLAGQLNGYMDGIEFDPSGQTLFAATGDEAGVVRISRMDPWRRPSELLISAAADAIDYGRSTKLTITFVGGGSGRAVTVWADPAGDRPRRILTELEVPDDGVAELIVSPVVTTKYTASFDGDASWEPVTSPAVEVQVQHVIRGRMLRADGRDGAYAVYRRSSRVYYKAVGEPPHRGETFTISLDKRMDGRWREIGQAKFVQNTNGVVVIYLESAALRSGRYAFRSWYGRDVLHVDGRSDPSLFRIR